MSKVQTLLMATDYSIAVMNAEHYAVQLAKNEGFFLRFMHVFQPPIADQVGSFDAAKIDTAPALDELRKLKIHVSKLMQSMGVKPGEVNYECMVREGGVAQQIIDEAKESFPDFIVMGTHGESGFREFILGSHTWKVIKKAGIPVLALPKDAYYCGFKKIVYATEYREGELPVINFITQFASRFRADVTVLHITANMFSEEFEKKISSDFMHEVKDRINYPRLEMRVLHATDIINGIEDFNARQGTDLLVMTHEKPYFLEKIFTPNSALTKKMSLHTHVPLLVVPDYYNPDFAWFWKLFALDYSLDSDF